MPYSYRVDLSYRGSGFKGFQVQPGLRTVQGELEAALSRLFGAPIRVTGAGRTDAGVHARHQVISFVAEVLFEPRRLLGALNGVLPPDVRILEVRLVEEGFCARRSPRAREYVYFLWDGEVMPPFLSDLVWHFKLGRLDERAMGEAASLLVGSHDFSSFCKGGEVPDNPVREVQLARLRRRGDLLWFRVRANAFLCQMVRIMVGSLVLVGRGIRPPSWIGEVLEARDRKAAGPTAPPHGLYLWRVHA